MAKNTQVFASTGTPTMYRGTSFTRNSAILGLYSGTMHRALWCVQRGGRFLMSEVPLYAQQPRLCLSEQDPEKGNVHSMRVQSLFIPPPGRTGPPQIEGSASIGGQGGTLGCRVALPIGDPRS